MLGYTLKRGDILQVQVTKTDRNPGLTSTFIGEVLETNPLFNAIFILRVETDTQGHYADIEFNLNQVEVMRLYAAKVARGEV